MNHRVVHLQRHSNTSDKPIASVQYYMTWAHVSSADITTTIQSNVIEEVPDIRLAFTNISTRYLRAGGAIAILLSKVDSDTIRPVPRWQSKTML